MSLMQGYIERSQQQVADQKRERREAELALRRDLEREAEQDIVHITKLTAARALTEAQELIALASEHREAGKVRYPSQEALALAKAASLLLNQGLLLEGRATQIVEHRDLEQTLGALARAMPGLVVDSTAEEE